MRRHARRWLACATHYSQWGTSDQGYDHFAGFLGAPAEVTNKSGELALYRWNGEVEGEYERAVLDAREPFSVAVFVPFTEHREVAFEAFWLGCGPRQRGSVASRPASGPFVTILWFVSGMFWVAEAAVPWTRRGMFSSSSMLDGASLSRAASSTRWFPPGPRALLLRPILGVVVGATAVLRAAPWVVRLICVVVVSVRSGFMHNVASADPARLGTGAWLTVAGIVLGVVVMASDARERAMGRGERRR